ncbi:MAG: SDR family NAD(P)-dependent oxidoreductase [Erysipelotrichaceae bacterium]|nr:SDR family NAD(P)-dependent oxidoreductase [Erysipelotrichaceae bacterium]
MKQINEYELLNRKPSKFDLSKASAFIRDKVVMVTGGGGSIGSELCRQVAKMSPRKLVILDMCEENIFWIKSDLQMEYGNSLNIVTVIANVQEVKRFDQIMEEHRPDFLIHAAAYKHVPLMEENPNEAIKNNVLGTYNAADAAMRYHVQWFVLISTDKAVRPASIMGASKRICELMIQMMNHQSHEHALQNKESNYTRFSAVRFGNVLGSSGSVLPIFRKQIEEGNTVTVTDKNVTRYFMTVQEAVSLVLEATYYTQKYDGDIFVLDMGEPIKIDDFARNLIQQSGYTPDVDIKVEYTGLRSGEKIFEDCFIDKDKVIQTENEKIYIEQSEKIDDVTFKYQLQKLISASLNEAENIKELIKEIVPTYKSSN